jgi:hypothetical protein
MRLPDACRPWVEHQTTRRREFIESSGCHVVGNPDELAVDPARFALDVVRPDDAEVLDAVVQVVGELTDRIARRRRRIRPRAGTADAARAQARASSTSDRRRRGRRRCRGCSGRAGHRASTTALT